MRFTASWGYFERAGVDGEAEPSKGDLGGSMPSGVEVLER